MYVDLLYSPCRAHPEVRPQHREVRTPATLYKQCVGFLTVALLRTLKSCETNGKKLYQKKRVKLNPRNYLSKLSLEAKLRICTAKKVNFTRCCPSKQNEKKAMKGAFHRFRKSRLYDFRALRKDCVQTLLKLPLQ